MTRRREEVRSSIAVLAVLALAATTATAHDRGGGRGGPLWRREQQHTRHGCGEGAQRHAGEAQGRDQDSARSRIDDAVADGDIPRDDVADLKGEVADNLQPRCPVADADGGVELGISTTRLNDGFRAARKARFRARIDQALDDKRIDKDRADELRDELDDADLPGYKGGFGGFGGHRGR